MNEEPAPRQEFGIVNCLAPIVCIVTAVFGARLGGAHGVGWGIVGGVVGFVAGAPVTGLLVLLVVGVAWLASPRERKKL